MEKVLPVIETKRYLLIEYHSLKVILNIIKKRQKNVTKHPEKTKLIDEAATTEIKNALRNPWGRGLWKQEQLQDKILRQLLEELEDMGHAREYSFSFKHQGAEVPKRKLIKHIELYGNRLVAKLSRISGSFGKEFLEEEINWKELETEAKESEEDIQALLSLLNHLTFKHSPTNKTLKAGIREELEKLIAKDSTNSKPSEMIFLSMVKDNISDLIDLSYELMEQKNIFKPEEIFLLARHLYLQANGKVEWDFLKKVIKLVLKSKVGLHLDWVEISELFLFSSRVAKEINDKKIDFLYALDRSARVLGLLIMWGINRISKSRKIKLRFIREHGEFYDKKQAKELSGKNVLILDEKTESGSNLEGARETLLPAVEPKGKVYTGSFYGIPPDLKETELYDNFLMDLPVRHGAPNPSWYGKILMSGINEVGEHHVKILTDSKTRLTAIPFRKSLSKFADAIALYLTKVGY